MDYVIAMLTSVNHRLLISNSLGVTNCIRAIVMTNSSCVWFLAVALITQMETKILSLLAKCSIAGFRCM